MKNKLLQLAVAGVIAFGGTFPGLGQVTSHPNTLQGTIRFNNFSALGQPLSLGMTGGIIGLSSVGRTPEIDLQPAFGPQTASDSATYAVQVESDAAGIIYRVRPRVTLNGGKDYYWFAGVESPKVFDNSQSITANLSECLSLVNLRFVDSGGTPVPIQDLNIYASRPDFSRQYQASGITQGASSRFLFLRGDSHYTLEIQLDIGHDPYSDRVRFVLPPVDLDTVCNQVILRDIQVPAIPPNVGRITGIVDIVGQTLLRTSDGNTNNERTLVIAENGPLGNRRLALVPKPNFTDPSNGPYQLVNLGPSVGTDINHGYDVHAEMQFRRGYDFTWFRTPTLTNILVPPATTVNLNNALAITPGYIEGNIRLQGPPGAPVNAILQSLTRSADNDPDHDGIPVPGGANSNYRSMISVVGVNRLAANATHTAANGNCRPSFGGDYNMNTAAFDGDYEAVVGGLYSEPSLWKPETLLLSFENTATSDENAYVKEMDLQITDNTAPEIQVVPNQHYTHNVNYCFSEVCIRFRSSSSRFYAPRIAGPGGASFGSFHGMSVSGCPTNYSVAFLDSVFGTPGIKQAAADTGMVRLLLPQGTYHLNPHYTDAATDNDYGLVPITDLVVGSQQRICIDQCLQLALNLPACISDPLIRVTGQVRTLCSNRVTAVVYQFDGGPPMPVCQDCGLNPSLDFEVFLNNFVGCSDHTLVVTATDDQGAVSSVTSHVFLDFGRPRITCPPDIIVPCTNASQVPVNFTVTATDDCTPNPQVVCTPPSGSSFRPGTTPVTCTAQDACGNRSVCTFNVTVQSQALSIERAICVRWGCGILQGADDLGGLWTDIPGASNPYCVPSSQARKFYRTRQ